MYSSSYHGTFEKARELEAQYCKKKKKKKKKKNIQRCHISYFVEQFLSKAIVV